MDPCNLHSATTTCPGCSGTVTSPFPPSPTPFIILPPQKLRVQGQSRGEIVVSQLDGVEAPWILRVQGRRRRVRPAPSAHATNPQARSQSELATNASSARSRYVWTRKKRNPHDGPPPTFARLGARGEIEALIVSYSAAYRSHARLVNRWALTAHSSSRRRNAGRPDSKSTSESRHTPRVIGIVR